MKNYLLLLLLCLSSSFVLSQEKWGSYDGSFAGSQFTLVEACGDSIELSPGDWYERMHVNFLGSINDNGGRKVIGDSVFYKNNLLDNSAPTLLYDFSAEIGDTINGNWDQFIVTFVDAELVAGIIRKRIVMESTTDGHLDVWLSGIGSRVNGYLNPGSPEFITDAGSEFSCYFNGNNGEFYFADKDPALCLITTIGSACLSTSTSENELNTKITVFPNPTTDFINIELEDYNNKEILTQLFSIDGREILTADHIDNLSLDVSKVNAGIYYLKISHNGGLAIQRIIIQ